MKSRFLLTALLVFFITAVPAFAQNNCPSLFKKKLENIPGVKTVEQDKNGFLTILDTSSRSGAAKAVSLIKKLRKNGSTNQCDFSGTAVSVLDRNLNQVKSGTDGALKKSDLSNLLYKYVYRLDPVEVEENLRGYNKLHELSPGNSYYAARIEHYENRIQLIKDRNNFIASAEQAVTKDKSIIDLKIKKDFYLFVAATDNPLAAAEKYLDKIGRQTPRPDKKICIIAYSQDLKTKEADCPAEYQNTLHSTEEELLMRHVQSLPSYLLEQNMNGYEALKKLNPSSTLYTKKLASYKARQLGLEKFIALNSASGKRIFAKTSQKGGTLYATVDESALNGRSGSANEKLFQLLTSYLQYSGGPVNKCVLKNSSGTTVGTITCTKSGCSFK